MIIPIYNSISITNYCDEPFSDLVLYDVDKVLSAWTEVWSGRYRSRARFWLPGVVAIWADFKIV